jgi:hypothetical protein
VQYDPARVSPQDLLRSVGKQGFTATVVAGGAQGPPP